MPPTLAAPTAAAARKRRSGSGTSHRRGNARARSRRELTWVPLDAVNVGLGDVHVLGAKVQVGACTNLQVHVEVSAGARLQVRGHRHRPRLAGRDALGDGGEVDGVLRSG
jgi:hypothetical protein